MRNRTAAVAAMRGLALGDAFGETWFRRTAEVAGRRLAPGPWRWTDDTAMALSLLKVLYLHGHVDQAALAAEFAAEYAADPYRNYGPSMHDVLAAFGAGEAWREVTRSQFDGLGSWGNGTAMRVAPLGAWFAGDLDTVVEQALRSAEVTHAHPEAAAGAVAVAVAAASSVEGTADLLGAALDRTPASEVATGLERARVLGPDTDPRAAARVLGCGYRISAMDTVPYALWCAARHPDDLVEALWTTASAGGDVDTTCAIVGGIIAARTGLAGVPAEWLERCEPLPAWVDQV